MASKLNDDPLFSFLKQGKFEKYFEDFKKLGAEDIQDVLDGVDKEVLTKDIGMTSLEANKFLKILKNYEVSYYCICISYNQMCYVINVITLNTVKVHSSN